MRAIIIGHKENACCFFFHQANNDNLFLELDDKSFFLILIVTLFR